MKTPKVKKRDISKHSRAARRGEDAAPNKPVGSTVEETDYKPWLHKAQDAGVSKKKKGKQLSRQQKLRHQKGLENADRNAEKLEKKLADSKARGKKIKARRTDWDDLNGEGPHVDVSQPKKQDDKTSTNSDHDKVELDDDMTSTKDIIEPPTEKLEALALPPQQPAQEAVVDEVT